MRFIPLSLTFDSEDTSSWHCQTCATSLSLTPSLHRPCPSPLTRVTRLSPSLVKGQFASFRSPLEEREYSRTAFFKFLGWALVTMTMSLIATKHKRSTLLA